MCGFPNEMCGFLIGSLGAIVGSFVLLELDEVSVVFGGADATGFNTV